ncbi:hypothetical protein O181_028148 [Austropuccinia psidii MF-1]|uniref:Uncharacterized protein n=1 Tax=Austropuccinia psidii MF-1 TaxID=1389203 RepID=A0A9Q3CQY5_9BASI|nr:hypothetical protein [Austropuccinia psidii MF-1]
MGRSSSGQRSIFRSASRRHRASIFRQPNLQALFQSFKAAHALAQFADRHIKSFRDGITGLRLSLMNDAFPNDCCLHGFNQIRLVGTNTAKLDVFRLRGKLPSSEEIHREAGCCSLAEVYKTLSYLKSKQQRPKRRMTAR